MFSREIGGLDSDVKAYFFGLPYHQLRQILNEYERTSGQAAREYAEATIPKWRSGHTRMSGLVAKRLFSILPKYMPLDQKYALVEQLWRQHCPASSLSLRFGPDVDQIALIEQLREHLERSVKEYVVPDQLKARFKWLATDDSTSYQQLLNHFLLQDRDTAVAHATAQVAVIMQAVRDGVQVQDFSREVVVGRHRAILRFDRSCRGIRTEKVIVFGQPNVTRRAPYNSGDWGCLIYIVLGIAAIILYNVFKHHR